MEVWQDIPGFDKYRVSSHGHVQTVRTEHIMKPYENQYGVVCVGLMRDGQQFHRSLSRLVANAFLPKDHREKFDTPINLDGNRFNTHVENLMWRPRWFAVKYNRQFREPYENPIDVPIWEIDRGIMFQNSMEACITYGLLEEDLVLSILNHTVVWPSFVRFELLSV